MPLVLRVLEGDVPRATGEEDRAGFVGCRRPVISEILVLKSIKFLGEADTFPFLGAAVRSYQYGVQRDEECPWQLADSYV